MTPSLPQLQDAAHALLAWLCHGGKLFRITSLEHYTFHMLIVQVPSTQEGPFCQLCQQ